MTQALADQSITWTDRFTAYGTVGLAVVAVGTVIVSVLVARNQRVTAETSAKIDRDTAAVNLSEQRSHDELMRLRDRQSVHALALLEVLGRFEDVILDLPIVNSSGRWGSRGYDDPRSVRREQVADAVADLRAATQTTAVLIHHREIQNRVNILWQLVLLGQKRGVEGDGHYQLSGRDRKDILSYIIFIQVGIQELVGGGDPQPIPFPQYPILKRSASDGSVWRPNPAPPGFGEAARNNPGHPEYEAIENRQRE